MSQLICKEKLCEFETQNENEMEHHYEIEHPDIANPLELFKEESEE